MLPQLVGALTRRAESQTHLRRSGRRSPQDHRLQAPDRARTLHHALVPRRKVSCPFGGTHVHALSAWMPLRQLSSGWRDAVCAPSALRYKCCAPLRPFATNVARPFGLSLQMLRAPSVLMSSTTSALIYVSCARSAFPRWKRAASASCSTHPSGSDGADAPTNCKRPYRYHRWDRRGHDMS